MADEPIGEVTENISGTTSFVASAEAPDPMRPTVEPKPAPEGVPEKFWDADKGALNTEALLSSYKELETKLGQPKDESPEDKPEDKPEDAPEDKPEDAPEDKPEDAPEDKPEDAEDKPEEAAPADLTAAVESAQAIYAEKGELPAEAREPFLKAGISNEQIDLYLQGVQAYEQGLRSAAMKAAGVDDYAEVQKAIEWAATNWSEKKVLAFNAQSGDPETVGLAITALFKDYRGAEPGEGKLTNVTSGTNRGDVYTDREAFNRDLEKADLARDRVARREIIAKMDRSIKAGSLKK